MPYARIEIVRFLDDVGDKFEEKILHGPIHLQLKEALDYLKYQVVLEKVMKVPYQAEAIRVFNYPYAALEEVLCNAVFHKSWDDRNPIEVRINPNDIEVFNIEGPMPPLTQKDIQQERVASRNYRNRRIGDFLKELHLTEGRSTGFPKIRQAPSEEMVLLRWCLRQMSVTLISWLILIFIQHSRVLMSIKMALKAILKVILKKLYLTNGLKDR